MELSVTSLRGGHLHEEKLEDSERSELFSLPSHSVERMSESMSVCLCV